MLNPLAFLSKINYQDLVKKKT